MNEEYIVEEISTNVQEERVQGSEDLASNLDVPSPSQEWNEDRQGKECLEIPGIVIPPRPQKQDMADEARLFSGRLGLDAAETANLRDLAMTERVFRPFDNSSAMPRAPRQEPTPLDPFMHHLSAIEHTRDSCSGDFTSSEPQNPLAVKTTEPHCRLWESQPNSSEKRTCRPTDDLQNTSGSLRIDTDLP